MTHNTPPCYCTPISPHSTTPLCNEDSVRCSPHKIAESSSCSTYSGTFPSYSPSPLPLFPYCYLAFYYVRILSQIAMMIFFPTNVFYSQSHLSLCLVRLVVSLSWSCFCKSLMASDTLITSLHSQSSWSSLSPSDCKTYICFLSISSTEITHSIPCKFLRKTSAQGSESWRSLIILSKTLPIFMWIILSFINPVICIETISSTTLSSLSVCLQSK